MNKHIIELTADGPLPKQLNVDELDVIFFKNLMDEDTVINVKKGLLKPKGKIEVAAITTSGRRRIKKHQSGTFSFTYTVPGITGQATRNGTIRV